MCLYVNYQVEAQTIRKSVEIYQIFKKKIENVSMASNSGNKNENVKIADFGCSETILCETVSTKYNGTLAYMAPELIKR